ncbi:MAG: DegT/DnrJ/EryC1/StrS family aminotransferase [Bdellovibrionota bacterium]
MTTARKRAKLSAVKSLALDPFHSHGPLNDGVPLYTALPVIPDPAELLNSIKQLLNTKIMTNRGPMVQRFELGIADYVGDRRLEAVTCANGTLALELVLRGFKLKGKVLVPPFTFVATVNAIVNVGLEPVFVDIDPETLCLSPKAVDEALTHEVCAVVPVHVYGNPCDIFYFESLRKKGVRVIYDSAHAFGVKWNGMRMGRWGDAEVFSFHATKILSACEGGAVVTANRELASAIKNLSNFGILNETEVDCVGTNAKLSEVHALFGLHSLAHLDEVIEHRVSLMNAYRELLADVKELRPLKVAPETELNGQYFPVMAHSLEFRDALYERLKAFQVISRRYFYPPLHKLKPFRDLPHGPLPVAEDVANRVLCLPLHGAMQIRHVEYVVDCIKKILGK